MKLKHSFLSVFTFVFLLTSTISAQSFLDSLQANFEFNRGALADESSNASDAVGYDITSDVGIEGSINGAYKFNGTSSWMNCGTGSRNITNQITISAWFKTTSSGRQIIVSKYDGNEDRGYFIGIYQGEASLEGRDGSNVFHRLTSGGITVTDGQWHHLVGTINRNQWRLYVDCQLVDELITNTNSPQFNTTVPLTIARLSPTSGNGEDRYFKGSLDNVKLFNIALTDQEVKTLSPFSCTECIVDIQEGMVAYYPLNGNGLDESGNNLHGTVGGAMPTENLEGESNAAMRFDGEDDYILVANADELNFGTGEFAISLWAKPEAPNPTDGPQMLIQKGDSGVEPQVWIRVNGYDPNTRLRAVFGGAHYPATILAFDEPFFSDLGWHHIVFQRTAVAIEVWVDGKLERSLPDTQFRNVNSEGNLIIGAQNAWPNSDYEPSIFNFYKGSIDEVRLYNKSLCIDEIAELSSLVNQIIEIPEEIGKINIFPNPVSDWLRLDLNFQSMTKVDLNLTDITGQNLWQFQWKGQSELFEKDLGSLPAGVYLLNIYLPEHDLYQSHRIVKE